MPFPGLFFQRPNKQPPKSLCCLCSSPVASPVLFQAAASGTSQLCSLLFLEHFFLWTSWEHILVVV